VSAEVAQDGLELVWELDPPGCGARSLSECLAIQARFYFPEDDTFPKLVSEECLHHLERRNYTAIAKLLALDVEDVIEYHRMMQDQFEPYPGRAFTGEDARYITPDIYLEKTGDGWAISLNEDGMPELKVSAYYQKIFRTAKKADREYLLDKLRGAEFLIKSIHKRRQTIRKVMESLLTHQRDFFELGRGHLRPLVLQDVADDVGVHMSTVSRATTNKYVHTPHGIFELKYFFGSGLGTESGSNASSTAVRALIKQFVAAESANKPLSDNQISDMLREQGIECARRTVAKYREALRIAPANLRKTL
jgi:RNA polymerase sigma-54 factor